MNPQDATADVVASNLRELPNVALDAALDLFNQGGPSALARLIANEFCRRHPAHLSPEDL
jgi:hypothetical protein